MDWGKNSSGKGSNVEMSGQITVNYRASLKSFCLPLIHQAFLPLSFSLTFTECGFKKILAFPLVPVRGKGLFFYFASLDIVLVVLLHQYQFVECASYSKFLKSL